MDSTGRGFALYSISLLDIIDTDYLPNTSMIHFNIGCEGRGEFQGTTDAFKDDLS